MVIREIHDIKQKKYISRRILENLPEWFGIQSSVENYIKESAKQIFYASFDGKQAVGFLTLKQTGDKTMEIAVMGVLKKHQREGIGTALVQTACRELREKGYKFLQVKTLKMGEDPYYDKTNNFYKKLGFSEFELIPEIWGEANPCQIYVKSLT